MGKASYLSQKKPVHGEYKKIILENTDVIQKKKEEGGKNMDSSWLEQDCLGGNENSDW